MPIDLTPAIKRLGYLRRARKPRLIEVGRRYSRGRPDARIFRWSTRRIGAVVSRDGVRLKRSLGCVGSERGLRLSYEQLLALDRVVAHWVRRREEWAAWSEHFNGVVASFYYQPPGARAEQQALGLQPIIYGRPSGQTRFYGKESRRKLDSPVRLGCGAGAREMIWRKGERQGPAKGQQVGLVYLMPGGLEVKAYRDELYVRGKSGDVAIEPWSEPDFIRELIAVLRENGRPRRARRVGHEEHEGHEERRDRPRRARRARN
jgi:hypothetical protein